MKMFETCLRQQLCSHPAMTPQDVVKLCYQAACGAEHLLSDAAAAKSLLERELAATPQRDEPLVERISERVCRINLGAWKQTGMPVEWLFRMFAGTVFCSDSTAQLTKYLHAAEGVLRDEGFDMESWREYVTAYVSHGMPPVRHSEQYREREKPAYRIVGAEYLQVLPILRKLPTDDRQGLPYVIAIDGRAGAGKSTAAELLGRVLDGGVVHMDDFFLPLSLRTEHRLMETGGNVHYERFAEQVLTHLRSKSGFTYDRFECSVMDYSSKRTVSAGEYRVVEGSYSHHPHFGEYMDLRVFAEVESDEQLCRITARNGAVQAERFRTEWIPMENRYFAAYGIREQADIVIG